MRLLVTGDRNWSDRDLLWGVLDRLSPSIIGHGHCRGADLSADEWALFRGVEASAYPADWHPMGRFDRAAGHKRNVWMFEDFGPDLVVAFKDGFDFTLSAGGTEHMVHTALTGGVDAEVVNAAGELIPLYAVRQLPFR